MPIKKSDLYSSLWKSCDELRGGMDASQYKDYVLVLLFVKYVSDKAASRKDYLVEVPQGCSFADMVALKGKPDIGERLNAIVEKLCQANQLTVNKDADFDDDAKLGKGGEKVDRLSKLVGIFEGLDFAASRADGDDLLGDAYEYLMRNFATESGKSKGQFYTPAEVSRVMAKVIGVGHAISQDQTIYDPTCGSGSLLLKAHDEALGRSGFDLALYGQERDVATTVLAKMNMILHNCPAAAHDIRNGNTLSHPEHGPRDGVLKRFDYVVANPPFSDKGWTSGIIPQDDPYGRFEYGVPPRKNGDYAYLLHVLASMKSTGRGAIILPHGVLFRGGAEAAIRCQIVQRGYVQGIIGLPANLFFGTGIPACIVVLDKGGAADRKGVFMIDASKGFVKDGSKNRLRAQDIHRIVDTFTRQVEVPRYSRLVPLSEIADPRNDYNLNLPRYIDSSDPEDLQDIDGHLRGGIPERDIDALEAWWKVFPSLRDVLFQVAERPGYCRLRVPALDVKATILGHPEFQAFQAKVAGLFASWRAAHVPKLKALKPGNRPKALIEMLAEDLLATFASTPLLDPYDVYQHLMDYWTATMQDDVYLVAEAGWVQAARPRLLEAKSKEMPDFQVGKQKFKSDLLPASLVIARFFAAQQATVDALKGQAGALDEQLEEAREEQSGEGGLLEEVVEIDGDKRKIKPVAVKARLDMIAGDPDQEDERQALGEYMALLGRQADVRERLRTVQAELECLLAKRYGTLTEAEIQALVVDDKWMAALASSVAGELDRTSRSLSDRIRLLADRYATPLPQLTAVVELLTARVEGHLRRMGAVWE